MDYIKYQCCSMKARIHWAQEVLQSLGYQVDINNQRDKKTIKALKYFQESHGLTPNAMICEKTFKLLYDSGGSKIKISRGG